MTERDEARKLAEEIVTTPHPNLVLTQLDEEILIDRIAAALRERDAEVERRERDDARAERERLRAVQHTCTHCGYVAVTQHGEALRERVRRLEEALDRLEKIATHIGEEINWQPVETGGDPLAWDHGRELGEACQQARAALAAPEEPA